jgi:hypothetical protein
VLFRRMASEVGVAFNSSIGWLFIGIVCCIGIRTIEYVLRFTTILIFVNSDYLFSNINYLDYIFPSSI